MENKIGNYVLTNHILAKGSFGTIYSGHHYKTGEHVAIKTELHENTSLRHETRILQYLYSKGVRKIPPIYWYGLHDIYQVLILPFYSCNLETYYKKKTISSSQLSAIMIKCLDICQQIHCKYIVHRDIKPANFMIKNGDIYLIDFGLSTFYVDENGEPIEDYSDSVGTMVGTLKYVSLNIHEGHRYSCRDDLISLAYIYEYLRVGLTWNPDMPTEQICVGDEHHDDRSNILHSLNQAWKKSKLEHLKITQNNMLPVVYAIKYDETPDYSNIKKIFMETI